jgi:hypothetical protein
VITQGRIFSNHINAHDKHNGMKFRNLIIHTRETVVNGLNLRNLKIHTRETVANGMNIRNLMIHTRERHVLRHDMERFFSTLKFIHPCNQQQKQHGHH